MNALANAESRLGFALRDFQADAVDALLSGKDVMVSAPTGSGKTAIYQAACMALRDRGATVVLSPLIALIRDQRRRMEAAGLRCACLFSQLRKAERLVAIDDVQCGDVDVVLTTPETLTLSTALREALALSGVALMVVDEAHAYEEWAHSFRPAYRRAGEAAEAVGAERVLLCSATLSPLAAAEAAEAIGRWDWSFVRCPAVRPNLQYVGIDVHDAAWTVRQLAAARGTTGAPFGPPGIVYTTTARAADVTYARATDGGDIPLDVYHGQMGRRDRNEAQDRWMAEDRFVVATKAFGMGIDRANVRTVLHVELPASLIDYAQETGRAGRDGLPSVCALNSLDDGSAAAFLADLANPPLHAVRRVYEALARLCGEGWAELDIDRIGMESNVRTGAIRAARNWLAGSGVLEVRPRDRRWRFRFDDIAEMRLAGSKAGRRRLALLREVRRAARQWQDWAEITPDEIEDAAEGIYRDWRGALARMERDGVVEMTRGDRASRVRIAEPFEKFDGGRLQKARARAVAKLAEVRRFAHLRDDDRAAAITTAIELDVDQAREEIARRRKERE